MSVGADARPRDPLALETGKRRKTANKTGIVHGRKQEGEVKLLMKMFLMRVFRHGVLLII